MADAAAASGSSSGIKWGSVLKWTFRFAVMGIGFGVAEMALSELVAGGFIHSDIPIAKEILSSSIEFMDPIVQGLQDWMTGGGALSVDQAMEPVNGFFKSIHEFFGVHDTFLPPVATGTLEAPVQGAVEGLGLSAGSNSFDFSGLAPSTP